MLYLNCYPTSLPDRNAHIECFAVETEKVNRISHRKGFGLSRALEPVEKTHSFYQWGDDTQVMAFDEFLNGFLEALADPNFSNAGALDQYLTLDPQLRSNDEANIVDVRIAIPFLDALGYGTNERDYNMQKQNLRPDFIISIDEYPGRACFVIEDKNSTVSQLSAHRPQLHSYMSQGRTSRGILMNGRSILSYDHQESTQIPAIQIDLEEAVRAWRGAALFATGKTGRAALEYLDVIQQFVALWRRHCRESFADLKGLIDDLTLQNAKYGNAPHEISGQTWTPERSRIQIVPVTHQPDGLTVALRGIIAELEDDAGAQLAASEKAFGEYSEAAKQIPGESGTLSQQEETAVGDVLALCPDESPAFRESLELLTRQVANGVLTSDNVSRIKTSLYEVHGMHLTQSSSTISKLIDRITELAIKKRLFLHKLRERYRDSINVIELYTQWKENSARVVFQSSDEKRLRREFLAQTAYLVVIRMLLVRIMEDKGLMNRVFTNGGVALWFLEVEPHYLEHATGRGTVYLLELAYKSAQHLYAHFYGHTAVLDWYSPDRNAIIRLLHILARFDFSHIDRDIIGGVYNEYVEAEHKHESGLYYTPKNVVEFMLDRIGYDGSSTLNKKVIDIASGSGGFLVSAAKRLIDAHRAYWKNSGYDDIPPERIQTVLEDVRNSLFGIDLNPFACALAETNLLIQVIDLLAIGINAGQPATIDKFHVYNSDTLTFAEETRRHLYGTMTFPASQLPEEDQVKAGIGEFSDKFDFVVGNPPYVRADENNALSEYRARIKSEHPLENVRNMMEKKWDLYVPFVAQSFALLKEKGRLALITSNAISVVPYAEKLRTFLAQNALIDEVHFFPTLRLFDDVGVVNIIFTLTKQSPTAEHVTRRFLHEENL